MNKPKTAWGKTVEVVLTLLLTTWVLMLLLGILRAGLHPAIPAPGYGPTMALVVALNLLVPRLRKRT